MSTHSIYIEVSDEITTVIERLKSVPEETVALVVPKGAILLQSIVNLKLARKAAADADKQLVLVTTDKIGRNLASQLGIAVANTEKDIDRALAGAVIAETEEPVSEPKIIAGVKVHRYYEEEDEEVVEEPDTAPREVEPIIIPKAMMKEEKAEEPSTPKAAEEPKKEPAKPAAEAPALTRRTIPAVAVADTTPDSPEEDEHANTEVAPETVKQESAKQSAPSKPSEMVPPSKRRRVLGYSLFLAGLLVVAVIATSFLFLPKTTATLRVPATEWERPLDFTARTSAEAVSEDSLVLPAEVVRGEKEGSLTFKATGVKKVGEAATGTATLYNYDSTSPQNVPAGTTITASGKKFTTQEAVTVPGYSQSVGQPRVPGEATVAIKADEVGTESNLNNATANDITGPGIDLQAKVTTSGGSSRDVTVVSATDIANAKSSLSDQLKGEAAAALTEQLNNREVRYNESTDIYSLDNLTQSVQAGEEVAEGEVRGKGVLQRLVIDYATLQSAVDSRVQTDVPSSSKRIVDSIDIQELLVSENLDEAMLKTNTKGKDTAVIATDALRKELAGKTTQGGITLLTDSVPNSTATVTHRPGWWPVKRFPYFANYIVLDVTYE